MKIKKLNESSLVDKKVSTLGKDGKPMYFTDDQLKDAKAKYPEYDFEETTIDKSLPQGQKAYIAKKKVTEDIDDSSELEANKMTIMPLAGLNADGFTVIINDAAGEELFKKEYSYGHNASYDRRFAQWAEKDYNDSIKYGWKTSRALKPYVADIIDELCSKYGIDKNSIEFAPGKNIFTGGNVKSDFVDKMKKLVYEAKQIKVFGAKAKKLDEAEEILYVIKDSHGNQLSRPNPDDDELWDRVASMEARGRRGLCVVVYTGKKECLSEAENVQYGVHSFSQDAIIFRGTEEECGKYIDSHKELWDDAEVYRMEPSDPHYKKMDEAADYKVKFFQVFEAPKSPKENGKMIGQRGTLDDANAFGKEKVGEGNYIIKAVCDDGKTRPIDNDTKSDAYKMMNEASYGKNYRKSWSDDGSVYSQTYYISNDEYQQIMKAIEDYKDNDYGNDNIYGKYDSLKNRLTAKDGEIHPGLTAARLVKDVLGLENFKFDRNVRFVINDKKAKASMNEASYGGAFDIEDDQYFTRDDLNSFAEEVLGHISETFEGNYDIGGVWFENGNVTTQVVDSEGNEFQDTTHVDMRRIREPWHLKRMYAFPVATSLIGQIKSFLEDCGMITENVRGMGEYSDKFYDYLDFLSNEGNTGAIEYLASQLIRYCKEEDLKDLWFDRMNKVAQDNGFGVEDDADDIDEGKKLKEGLEDEAQMSQRYVDFEIPELCKKVLDHIPNMSEGALISLNRHCLRWHSSVEDVLDASGYYKDESLHEDVETPVLSAPTEGPESGLASLLNTAMQDELKTIQMYNDVSVTAKAEGFEEIAAQIDEINTEENKHVGQLQELLKTIAPNAQAIDAGELEAGDALVTVEENINNSTETPNNNSEDIKEAVIMERTERWEEIYQSFKNVEQELDGDGEAITAVIDRMYQDNKDDPDYKRAYDKWASNE